jgi:ubiquinone/menaquinone biosynthesis C-methylase UbiE
MSTTKSEKELAFIHDLYIATDWGERFAELIDQHVELPRKGRALYVGAGTGGHALALKAKAGKNLSLVCVDESEERLELARAKAAAIREETADFQHSQLEALLFDDEVFELVVADGSLVVPERLPEMLSEMVRVAAPGATVSLNTATTSSFGEFFSIFWEALLNTGHVDDGVGVETLIKELPTVSAVEELFTREGLEHVQSWTRIEEFDFASGEEFMNTPLVRDILIDRWFEALPHDDARSEVLAEVERIIDADRQGAEFAVSVKATIVVGRKGEL